MPFSLYPRVMRERLTDLTPEWLRAHEIELVLLDFDNTIVPYTTDEPTPETVRWFDIMREADIPVCIVSNSRRSRVPDFCAARGFSCVTAAGKPGTRGIREALTRFGCAPERAVLVGDQIYTDVLGANRAGVVSVLVRPIALHIFPLRVRNWVEQPWIQIAKRRDSHDKP